MSPGYKVKDKLENKLHDLVCDGKLTLSSVRRRIASNWQTLFKGRRDVHIVERAHIVYASGWEIGAGSAGKEWDLPSDGDVRRASWALGLVPMH